jgi:hypothetical protein
MPRGHSKGLSRAISAVGTGAERALARGEKALLSSVDFRDARSGQRRGAWQCGARGAS